MSRELHPKSAELRSAILKAMAEVAPSLGDTGEEDVICVLLAIAAVGASLLKGYTPEKMVKFGTLNFVGYLSEALIEQGVKIEFGVYDATPVAMRSEKDTLQ